MHITAGQIVGGKYRLVEALASGGMGCVWRARHVDLEVDVALKVMGSDLLSMDAALQRFKREARAAAMIRSPHVVEIHDYGVDGGMPYIVMEMLEGEDLKTLIGRERQVPVARAASIIQQAAKGLRLAHEAGIVHRDLKPANIFVVKSGDDEIVKVLDFGIAKEITPQLASIETTTNALLGSPLYMSPEQARGNPVDHRTDLWSLGVVALEMITGEHPFRGLAIGDILVRICSDDVPLPSARGVLVPGLDEFFARALARKPELRFASAKELAEAFCAVAEGFTSSIASPPYANSAFRREESKRSVQEATPSGAQGGVTPVDARESDTRDIFATSPPRPRNEKGRRRGWLWAALAPVILLMVAAIWMSSKPRSQGLQHGQALQRMDGTATVGPAVTLATESTRETESTRGTESTRVTESPLVTESARVTTQTSATPAVSASMKSGAVQDASGPATPLARPGRASLPSRASAAAPAPTLSQAPARQSDPIFGVSVPKAP